MLIGGMSKRLKDIDLYKIYLNWERGTGPFRCFFRATNFVTLKHYPDFELMGIELAENEHVIRLTEVIEQFGIKNTLFIIDLPGEQAIEVAFEMHRKMALGPIVTFNNIMHPSGLVGGKKTISSLIGYGEILQDITPKGYVFVLDEGRYGEYGEEELRKFFNNQYELTEEDMPPLEMLRDLALSSIMYIHGRQVKEDIESYLAYLHENGIQVVKHVFQEEK